MNEIENEIEPSKEYVDAFNDAYLISQHMPELADAIASSTGEAEILKGFKDGRQTYLDESFEKTLPDFLRDNPVNAKEPDLEKTRDVDIDIDKDIEPDIDR